MSAENDLHDGPHPRLLRQFQHLGAQLLADAAAVTTDEVVTRNTEPAVDPLLRPRMADIPLESASDLIRSGPSPGRRHGALIGAAAAASLLVVGLGVARRSADDVAPQTPGATTPSRAPAATSATGTAPSTVAVQPDGDPETLAWPPRLLLDATWNITDASERSLDEGGMSFIRDDQTVWVNWYHDPIAASGDSLDREALRGTSRPAPPRSSERQRRSTSSPIRSVRTAVRSRTRLRPVRRRRRRTRSRRSSRTRSCWRGSCPET